MLPILRLSIVSSESQLFGIPLSIKSRVDIRVSLTSHWLRDNPGEHNESALRSSVCCNWVIEISLSIDISWLLTLPVPEYELIESLFW